MSLDNGLLLEKKGDTYFLYYLAADNKSLILIGDDFNLVVSRIHEEQRNGLEYGTTFGAWD